MIKSINHIGISTPNLNRLCDFYMELFGFQKVFDISWKQGDSTMDNILSLEKTAANVVMIQLGDMSIEIFQFSHPDPKAQNTHYPVCDHGLTHICFQVTDIGAEYERLVRAGMVFHCPPQDVGNGTHVTYGRDIDGNVLELMETSAAEAS